MVNVQGVMRRCLNQMVVVVAILPTKVGDYSYIETVAKGFGAEYLEINDIGDLPTDKIMVFFHPRTHDQNPDWLPPERVEDFQDFDFPEDAYYIFSSDFTYSITKEISDKAQYIIEPSRWVKIPTEKEYKSLHGHQAAAIVMWEYYRRKKPDLKWTGGTQKGDGY